MVSPFFNPIHGTAHVALSLTKGPSLPAAAISQPLSPTDNVDALHAMILEQLDSDQAVETITIPLEGKSSIADHMVIASGRSTRQVASMAAKIAQRMKTEFKRSPRVEGLPAADWVLIDAGDVIVHLFRPEVRSFYNLERMWSLTDAPIVAGPAF
ncbi:ribosome silencing factor [soil metagenome]